MSKKPIPHNSDGIWSKPSGAGLDAQVADQFGVALATVQRWVARAGEQRLDRVDWTRPPLRPAHARQSHATRAGGPGADNPPGAARHQ